MNWYWIKPGLVTKYFLYSVGIVFKKCASSRPPIFSNLVAGVMEKLQEAFCYKQYQGVSCMQGENSWLLDNRYSGKQPWFGQQVRRVIKGQKSFYLSVHF
jgi:hypothetical protein